MSMRTTVVIEDDVLEAARSLAEAEGRSLGQVISMLARRGLAPQRQEDLEQPGLVPGPLTFVQIATIPDDGLQELPSPEEADQISFSSPRR